MIAIKEKFDVVGVRFLRNPAKIYHYRVPKRAKVKLGDALVVVNDHGTSVVAVVRLGPPEYSNPSGLITQKVASL